MNAHWITATGVCLLATHLTAGGWYVEREIVGKTDAATVVAVTLDDHAFAHSQAAWADVRVLDSKGREVPRVLQPEHTSRLETRHTQRETTLKDLEQLADGGLAVTCELTRTNAVSLTQLTVHTPLRNYEQTLTVFVPGPDGTWLPVRETEPLFDYSRYADVRKDSVELPALTNRVFRLVIGRADDKAFSAYTSMTEEQADTGATQRTFKRYEVENRPFRIDSVSFRDTTQVAVPDAPRTERTAAPAPTVTADKARKQTVLTVATGKRPVVGLAFDPDQQTFARTVELEYAVPGGWRTFANGSISRSRLPGMDSADRLEITFPETRTEQIRVRIRDDDNPPLTFGQDGITLVRQVYRVLFIAESSERYRLVYGNPDTIAAPVYEQNVLAYLSGGRKAVEWSLAAAPEGPMTYGVSVQVKRFLAKHGMLLISLIVMVTLGVLIARAVRHNGRD